MNIVSKLFVTPRLKEPTVLMRYSKTMNEGFVTGEGGPCGCPESWVEPLVFDMVASRLEKVVRSRCGGRLGNSTLMSKVRHTITYPSAQAAR